MSGAVLMPRPSRGTLGGLAAAFFHRDWLVAEMVTGKGP